MNSNLMNEVWVDGPAPERHRVALVAASVAGAVAMAIVTSAIHTEPPAPKPDLVRYEDGSGVLYIGDTEVATYPADTFVWHCATMGNHVCGDVDDADLSAP
jgi:hypothetical protein